MKLLIITQKVDLLDGNLSFFHDWIVEFSKHCEKLTVICLQEGKNSLPENVKVLSLGKESGKSRFKYLYRFYKYIWQERKNYDAVFVHMNPEYTVLGGIFWKLLGKKIALWYTHQSVTLKLRLASLFCSCIFTASKESFKYLTNKPIYIFGHGINTDRFKPLKPFFHRDTIVILSDTRIARSKNIERTLKISQIFKETGVKHQVLIVGGPITADDHEYFTEMKNEVARSNLPVRFVGTVPYSELPNYYEEADIFLNHANPGGLNKVVLQAMSSNLYVLTSNESYRGILPDEEVVSADPQTFVNKINSYIKNPQTVNFRDIILRDHDLKNLITKLLGKLA